MRWAEAAAWAGLALGVYGAAWFVFHDSGPDAVQFRPAMDWLRTRARAEDVIFLLPAWATRAREGLGHLDVRATSDPLWEDLEPFRRVWLFALFDAHREVRAELEAAGARLELERSFPGNIDVLGFRLPGSVRTRYDFEANLARARVRHHTPSETFECDRVVRRGRGWDCPSGGDWLYVAPEWQHMGAMPRRCLWAHPPAEGQLSIQYPDVPTDGVLVGRAGHTTYSSRRARAPVDLTVRVDTSTRAVAAHTFRFEVEDTWRPFRVDLAPLEVATATVSFSISTSDAGANHFCFVADVRQREGSVESGSETDR